MGMPESSGQPSPPRRVLIVEDDALTRLVYQSALKTGAGKFACHCEATGEGALDYLRRKRADVVVLDWDLPGISGLAVLRTIRSTTTSGEMPVLMVTGHEEATGESIALKCGADMFLPKPVSPEDLLTRLRELTSADSGTTSNGRS